jgi:hypothetical protein
MRERIPPADDQEYWSERDQGVHHTWEPAQDEEHTQRADPADFSAVGGPDGERVYGRVRSDAGAFPFGPQGAADRDPYGPARRGGYLKIPTPSSVRDEADESPETSARSVGQHH